jgi:hypothetical protein
VSCSAIAGIGVTKSHQGDTDCYLAIQFSRHCNAATSGMICQASKRDDPHAVCSKIDVGELEGVETRAGRKDESAVQDVVGARRPRRKEFRAHRES